MATKTIDNINWAYTVWWKRILRGIIGVSIYVAVFVGFEQIPRVDLPTAYFFNRILPHLIATYLLYGIVPILSKYIGLVQIKDTTKYSPSKDSKDKRSDSSGSMSDNSDKDDKDEDNNSEERKEPKEERKQPLLS